jgi:hypothetical protein
MANFGATLRTGIRDVAGLILSCNRDDIEEDTANPGFVRRWRNRAPGLPSKPQYRAATDPKTYDGGRCGDPAQSIFANQPAIVLTGGGQKRVQFNRAQSQFLEFSTNNDIVGLVFPGAPPAMESLAVAYQFEKGVSVADPQTIMVGGASYQVDRRTGGNATAVLAGPSLALVGDHQDGTFLIDGDADAAMTTWYRNNVSIGSQAGAVSSSITGQGYIGRSVGGDYLDGILDSIHVWSRLLSPLERDFVWSKLDEDGTDFAVEDRAAVSIVHWSDTTGDTAAGQINRLRPVIGANHFFKRVTVPNSGVPALRVQLAAAVDGLVLPDSLLGGDLFVLDWAEVPGSPPMLPAVSQDAGWSAVFDCELSVAGHYTAVIRRPNGGSVILHFDVEVTV